MLNQFKVTLSTGKIVVLRKLQIKDPEVAAQEVVSHANGDALLLQLMMLKPLVKNLIVSIDGMADRTSMEKLDDYLEYGEYQEVLSVVQDMMGQKKAPKIDLISSGDK